MKETITISIEDVSVTIPETSGQIDDIMIAIKLCLELYGYHRNTIEEYLNEYKEEIK